VSCVFVINRPINGPYAVIDAYIELVAGIPKGKITLFFDAPAVPFGHRAERQAAPHYKG
jgi:hypothetical protein